MSEHQTLELLMRGGAVGAFFSLAVVMARGLSSPARVTGVLFCLAAAAHTLTQQGDLGSTLRFAWPIIWGFSAMGAGLFWAFATELFGDRSRLQLVRLAPAALLLTVAILAAAGLTPKALWLVHNLIGAALMGHVLLVIWTGWRNDLVESRRRLRGPVLAAAAVYAATIIGIQISGILWRPADSLSPLGATMLLVLGVAGIGALLQADPDLFAPASQVVPAAAAPSPRLSPAELRLAGQLDRLMGEARAYRDESLTISTLALKLAIPEYRLRRLINRQLGHRNFNAFMNRWRLDDTKQALADPAQREVPISTIALDAGFQSLGPFNRAFKAETGLTPSEFRAQALAVGGGTNLLRRVST